MTSSSLPTLDPKPDTPPPAPRGWTPSLALRLLLLLIAFAAVLALAWSWRSRENIEAMVTPEIDGVLGRDSVAARRRGPEARAEIARMQDFYRRRAHRPAWLDGDRPDPRALDLVRALGRLSAEGLDPASYGAPELSKTLQEMRGWSRGQPVNPARLAHADVKLTAAYLHAADDLYDGRVPAREIDPDWRRGDTLDLSTHLHRALARHRIPASLEELAPPGPEYHRLREALRSYREIARRGGWRALPFTTVLKAGDEGAEVDSLRERLALEGLIGGDGPRGIFDPTLQKALRTWQRRRGLAPDGRLTPATRAALDVPARARVRQIEVNLERRRWLPRERPEPYIEVNIPDFRLDVIEGGRPVLGMRVVVGAVDTPTPVFSDEVAWIEVNPTWRIPRGLVANEVLPAWQRDRDYFWKNHLHVIWTQGEGMPEVLPEFVDWENAAADTFPFIVFQEAGPTNPLGQIKFMCPNEHDVYLHDTNVKRLFAAGARDRSHGCVRVENPIALAQFVLRDTSAGSRDSLDTMLASTDWRRVRLKQKLPVHLMYWTAWVDSAGGVQFRDDVYDLDQRLGDALKSPAALAAFELNPKLVKVDEAGAARSKKKRLSLWSRMRLF